LAAGVAEVFGKVFGDQGFETDIPQVGEKNFGKAFNTFVNLVSL